MIKSLLQDQSRTDFVMTEIRCNSRLILLILISAMSTACHQMLGPEFQKPDVKLAESWSNKQVVTEANAQYLRWWKVFNDPVLDRLIELATLQNLSVQTAAVRIVEARAKLGIARGNIFPQTQQIQTGLMQHRLSQNEPNAENYDHRYAEFNAGFDAIWEVDIWGKFRRGIESADAMLSVSEMTYADIYVSMTAEVASTYLQIRSFEERLKLAKLNNALQTKSLRIAQAQYRNGLTTELDVQQAASLLHATAAMIQELEIGLRQSQYVLSYLLGQQPQYLHDLLGEGEIPKAASTVIVGIPSDILKQRPDIRREELRAAAHSAMIGVATAELYPRLSLQGSISTLSGSAQGIDTFDVFTAQTLATKFGPTITWPILHYGRLKNNVRIHDAKYQEQLIIYQDTVLRALREVEEAMIGYSNSYKQTEELKKSVDASRRAVEISLSQYQQGMDDYNRVLITQQFLVKQQDKLIATESEYSRYLVALYKALGGGWEIKQGQQLLPDKIREEMERRTDWSDMLTSASNQESKQ